jgi:hypothetical protein
MSGITWLHLSDWHQQGQDFDRDVVRDALIKDIRMRERIDSTLAQVDFVVFSGDLAFSGESVEYEAARLYFLNPIMDAVGLDPSRLFIVPGNHDLSRDTIYEMLPTELQKSLDSPELVQKWLSDQRLARTLEPFEAYREFVSTYTGQPTPDYASIVHLDLGHTQVALLGLNSAWMTARNKDEKGEIYDYGYTLIGEPQIHNALAQIAGAELRIVVLHHPFEWLSEFDLNRTEARLRRECHFILRGHVHTPQVQVTTGTTGDCVVIPAGASYKRRVAENPRYTNSYNWVHLDGDAGHGMVYLRRWSEQRNEWIEDIDAHPEGKFALEKLPKTMGKKKATTEISSLSQMKVSPPRFERERVVLEGYLNALIRNNTDLEPGGIKQTKVRVVLPLDSIYVGLQADRDRPDVDRRVMQEELDEIKKNLEREEDPKEREKQYQIWAHHSRVIQQALEIAGPREDLSNIVQHHRQVVILGDPGSGKTTLVRYLTLRLARVILAEPERLFQSQELWDEKKVWRLPDLGPIRLPILLRISHYAEARQRDPDLALVDYLPRYFAGLSVPHADELGELLQRLLDEGRCMVLLDGLDEIIDPTDRRNIAAAIGQFASVYRETGLPDWLARSLAYVPARKDEREEGINIQWDKDIPEDVRLEWGKQIRQRPKEWRRRGLAVRLAWELLDEARYAHIGNRFVVTSRIAGYHFAGVPGEFEHFTIRRMSLEDIKLFLEKWCPAVERRIAEAPDPTQVEQRSQREINGILKAVETTPGVRRMAENPLLLRILAIIHRNEAHLPQRRVELYETASVTLLRDWHLERGTPKGAAIDDIKATSLLGPVALYIHENRASGFLSKGETERILGGILARERGEKDPEQPSLETREAVQDFLDTVREHSGLFVERGEGLYGFMHLTFEEYFTARQLVSSATRARSQILERLHLPRWREPILLAIGSLSKQFYDDTHDLLSAILEANSPYERTLHRDLLFTADCVGDSVNVAPVLRQEIAKKLFALYCDRHGAGRFRLLQQQVKDALLTLCNDQGDAAVEDALAETITCCARDTAFNCALDAVDWLKARTPVVANALANHPDLGLLPRAQELLQSVQARLPVNGNGGGRTPTGWNAVRDNPELARLLGALWRYSGWHKSLSTSLKIQEEAMQTATRELDSISLYQGLELSNILLEQFKEIPTAQRDTEFWSAVTKTLADAWRISPGNSDIKAVLSKLIEAIIDLLENQKDTQEIAHTLERTTISPIFFLPGIESPTTDVLTLEQALAQFEITVSEARDTIVEPNIDQMLQLAGSHLLKGVSASNTLAAIFAASAEGLEPLHSLADESRLRVNLSVVQSVVVDAVLTSLRSSTNGQQYQEAALFLSVLRHFSLTTNPEHETTSQSINAADIVCADLEGADSTRRIWALQALILPPVRERVQLTEAHLDLLLGLLDTSADQAAPAMKILFGLGLTSGLLSWCWSALRNPNHSLANSLDEQLEAVKEVKGDQQTLKLLDNGLRDETLRLRALELLRKVKWQGTDTFIQAISWLSGEDDEARHLAALLLEAQDDLLEIPRQVLMRKAEGRQPATNVPSWSSLGHDTHTVRLFSGLWLNGWNDALTQLWVAQPAISYLNEHRRKDARRFLTYPESNECIAWLLEKAEFGHQLIPVFQNAAARLVELEGTVAEGQPLTEHITAIQQEILAHIEALLAQPDTTPVLRAEMLIFVAAIHNDACLSAQAASGSDLPLNAWLHDTLAAHNLTVNSPVALLARLLTNDDRDVSTAASLALFGADLPTLLVTALVETAQSPDDRVRMKGMRSLISVGGKLPCDGSSNAVEMLVSSFQKAEALNDGIMRHLLFNALIGVKHTQPFWVMRWLNVKDEEGSAYELALCALFNVRQVSEDVLSLMCAVLNDSTRPLKARRAVGTAVGDILRIVPKRRSDASIHAALTIAVDDPDAELRKSAIYNLRWTSGQGTWPVAKVLLRVAQTQPDAKLRVLALGSLGRLLHTVREFQDVDVSKEALLRWLEKQSKVLFRFERGNLAEAIKQLPNLPGVKETPDAETLLIEMSHPEKIGLVEDTAARLRDLEKWHMLVNNARQEWDLRRYWLERLPLLPDAIAQVKSFLDSSEPTISRAAACALARLYHGDEDRPLHLRPLLPDDQSLLRALLDAAADSDTWIDEGINASHHPWAVKQITSWVESKLVEERAHLVDWMLDELDKSLQEESKNDAQLTKAYYSWPARRILIGILAELSERLTYRAFTRTRDLDNVVALFAGAATDEDSYDVRRFAIRALGNLQQLKEQVADVFFAACQDVDTVYNETRKAVTKFKVFGAGSLERLTTAISSPSITVAYHAALLLGELGLSRSEDLGREGRKRVADELVRLLEDPLAERIVYDFNQSRSSERVGPLYDVIYEALVRVVAGPDAPANITTQEQGSIMVES